MDDSGIESVGPVVVKDLVIILVLEWSAARHNGQFPAQTLAQNEVGDAAVELAQAVGECLVASQVGGDALETLQVVCADEVGDFLPCLGAVLCVWC